MQNILISLTCGILASLAFPGANIFWLAWVALAPVIYFMLRLPARSAFYCAAAFALGFMGSHLIWIKIFGVLPWILLTIFQSLFILAFFFWGRFTVLRSRYWAGLFLIPSLWIITEWIRARGMFGFTWGDLGYSQYKFLPVLQIASLAGVWGVSFLIVLFNTSLALFALSLTTKRNIKSASAGLVLCVLAVAGVCIYGNAMLAMPVNGDRIFKTAVLQGNISQDITGDYLYFMEKSWSVYTDLTLQAAKEGANLVIWPETTVPGCTGLDSYVQGRLKNLSEKTGANLVVGGWDESLGQVYNTAFAFSRLGIADSYAKRHLVPFGEFVPARKYLPFLQYYRVRADNTSPGSGYRVMQFDGHKVGTVICFESAFPEIARTMTVSGAEFLCIITNDEWFGKSAAAEQHFSKSIVRSVENGRYTLRAAATGISAVIDPRGRVLASLPEESKGMLRRDIMGVSRVTFYTRHGDWLVCISIIFAFFATVAALLRPRSIRAEVEL